MRVTKLAPSTIVIATVASVQIRGVAGGVAAPPPPTPLAPSDVSIAVAVMARWRFIPGH